MTRDSPQYFYERIAERFDGLDHPDDVRRRLSVVFDECLGTTRLAGMRTLDAGCGYGVFSEAAIKRGAAVVSLDIGERLVARAIARAGSRGLVADVCRLAVRDQSFDVVISSEMLEHTDAPEQAIKELARVLRADGLLVLTTPNRVWQGAVRAASRLRLRPFRGLEELRRVAPSGAVVRGGRPGGPRPSRLSSLAVSSRPEQCGENGREAPRSRTSGEVDGQSGGRRAKAVIGGAPA